MKLWMVLVLLPIVAAAGAGGGYWLAHRSAGEKSDDAAADSAKPDEAPTAKVSLAPVRRGSISREISAYGTVITPASEVRVVSVPFESRVTKVLVTAGQAVAANQALVEVAGSAATALAMEEAKTNFAAADRDYKNVKTRYDQKLATNVDLFTAENAMQLARGRLQSLQQSGAGSPTILKADAAGTISKVDAQIGQVVPVGGPLVEVAAQDKIEVKLGVEPKDSASLKIGEDVQLQRVDDPSGKAVAGKVRLVAKGIDPATRFVDVMISPEPNQTLLIDGFVIGKMSVGEVADALIVPKSAVLPADDGDFEVFTIADGKAVLHTVHIGVENDDATQIISDELKQGDQVVVVGNNELEKGMSVAVESAATQPATEKSPEDSHPAAGESAGPPAQTAPSATTQPAIIPPATTQPATTQSAAVSGKSNRSAL